MKKFFQYVFLFFLLSSLGIILTNRESARKTFQNLTGIGKPCTKPIEYSIGEIDQRFKISKEDLIQNLSQAEKIWETPAGKNLFQYNPEAELKINLIFDERQKQTNEAEILENNLEKLDSDHNLTLQEYNSLSSEYKKRLTEYNHNVDKYEKLLKDYNEDVKYWNSHGGAPENEYDKLKNGKEELESMYKKLEKERSALDSLVKKTNQAAQEENELVKKYNQKIETYKNKFGHSREFEKGIFDGKNINVYEFQEDEDLVMTLAHEMGHALGINHLQNPTSIMYYLIGEQDLKNPSSSSEDLDALKTACRTN